MKATLLGPSRGSLGAAAVVGLAAVALLLLGKPFAIATGTLFAILAASSTFAAFRRPKHAVATGTARASDGKLAFASGSRELLVPREDVVAARVTHQTLVLQRGWLRRNVRLRFTNGDEARALVTALGLDASKVRDRFATYGPADPRLARGVWWIGIAVGFAISMVKKQLGWAFIGVVLAQALLSLASHVDIGPDGVHLRWLFWTWFVPTREVVGIMRIRQDSRGILLHLAREGAPPLAIVIGRRPTFDGAPRVEHDETAISLENRIRELVASRRSQSDAASTVARWVEGKSVGELRTLLGDAQTFRDAAIEREDLWRVLEDAQVEAPVRARIAIALAGSDDDAKRRIASARDGATQPKLRIALERAIETDDEAAAEALVRLERSD